MEAINVTEDDEIREPCAGEDILLKLWIGIFASKEKIREQLFLANSSKLGKDLDVLVTCLIGITLGSLRKAKLIEGISKGKPQRGVLFLR